VKSQVLAILRDGAAFESVIDRLLYPLLAGCQHRRRLVRRGVDALLDLDDSVGEPGGRLASGLEGFRMALPLAIGAWREIVGDPGRVFASLRHP
jgi:hypothetical protein